jgi:hypothetical protein
VIGGLYNMTADVYDEVIRQDPETGKIERMWEFKGTIQCMARGLGNLRGKDFGTSDKWKDIYSKEDYLRIKTMYPLSDSMRITRVVTSDGISAWKEESGDNRDTIFDVIGVTPVVEPFGTLLEYDVFLDRSEVQELDLWTE